MMKKRLHICFVLLLSLVLNLRAQQQPSPPTVPRSPASAQKPKTPAEQDQDLVRITTNLVQVDVVVTKDGKQVTDLKPEDFEIFEDGRAQKITQFSYVSTVPAVAANAPNKPSTATPVDKKGPTVAPALVDPGKAWRTIALVVDDLGTSFESMARIRKQLTRFLNEQLQPNDLVAIIRTGGEVGALQQFTTDKRVLQAAIENLKWNHCSRGRQTVLAPVRPFDAEDNPCVEDSLSRTITALHFILRGMRDLPGRKSMVILADNLPTEQPELFDPNSIIKTKGREGQKLPIKNIISNSIIEADDLQSVAELAIRSSVVIYGVDVGGIQTTGINAADEIYQPPIHLVKAGQEPTILIMRDRFQTLRKNREGAELLASQTGGFVVHNTNEFELQRVMDDQKGYYLIGYRPGDETFNRKFHHIKARVKRAGLEVRTRSGFFGVTEEQARAREVTPGDQMNRALTSPFEANDIPVRLTTFFVNEPAGSALRSILFLDARDLSFKEQPDGTHEAELDLSSIVFGNNGAVVNRKDQSAVLRLRGEPYDRVMREGLVYGFDLPSEKTGAFQVRVAVRDKTSARLGVAGCFVETPNLADNRLALSGIVVKNEQTSGSGSLTNIPATAEIARRPSPRMFRQGSTLIFAYAVYNAQLNKITGLPDLRTQTRIFRDGKMIFGGEAVTLDLSSQTDLKRVNGAARFHLGPELPPGEYVLQITVEDILAKEKQRTATQWIDFEVVK